MGRVDFEDGSFAEFRKAPKGKFHLLIAARIPGEERKGDVVNSIELTQEDVAKLLLNVISPEEKVFQPVKKVEKKASKKKVSKKKKKTTTKKAASKQPMSKEEK